AHDKQAGHRGDRRRHHAQRCRQWEAPVTSPFRPDSSRPRGSEQASILSSDMSQAGGDLFIIDNSISGWTGVRYLREWVDFANRFDIATGYFDVGSLLELDGEWQRLDKIRILMGADVSHSTKALIAKAVKGRAEAMLDASLESEKVKQPFLEGTDAIV